MKIETIILDCLKKHISGLNEVKECFMDGISEYANDNKMDVLINDKLSAETAEYLTSTFLEPFYQMPVYTVEVYFENYALIKEYKMLSNTVFDLARQKFMTGNMVTLPADVEDRTICCISKVYANEALGDTFAMEISDVIMEMDYLKDKTDKLSIRLARAK